MMARNPIPGTTPATPDPSPVTPGLSITVFCGAAAGTSDAVAIAHELGKLLAKRGHRLVYGGGGSGLMGALAWSAHESGAQIVGVIPHFLREREMCVAVPPQTVRITQTMGQRKDLMLDMADAFIALPGGIGTTDEILDVITLAQLHMHCKPLVLIETAAEWQPVLQMLSRVVSLGYAEPLVQSLLHVTTSAAEALEIIGRMTCPQMGFKN